MVRPTSVDPDKVQKCVKYLKQRPFLTVPEAMKQTNFSAEEVANLSLRQLIRRSLPSKTLKGLKAHALGSLTPPPPQPDRVKQRLNRAIDDEGAVVEPGSCSCAIAHTLTPLLPQPPPLATPQGGSSSSAVSTASAALMTEKSKMAANKWKWNRAYNQKKKKSKAVNSTTTTTTTTTSPTMAAADDWLHRVDGTVQRSNAANKMAKMRRIKPVVDRICNAISVEERASVLRAAIDHRDLVAAREFIGIDSTKEMSTAKYLCEQSARMLERSRKNNKARGKSSREKRDASEVVLTFTAPSPNRTEDVPSRRNRA